MKEQSHKEEMASLVQADFARLRARGVETTLAGNADAPAVDAEPPEHPVAAPVTEVAPPSATATGSWISRLLRMH